MPIILRKLRLTKVCNSSIYDIRIKFLEADREGFVLDGMVI